MKYDIAIIGGGITGLTAAIYAQRAGAKVVVFEREVCGGQMLEAPLIENYPGFLPSSGAKIIESVMKQVERLGIDIEYEEVRSIRERKGFYYPIECESGVYEAISIIIATGASHKKLKGISGDNVSYCPLCDGFFYKGAKVAVLGDGNSAMQYALYLADICEEVVMCTLTDKLFGEEEVIERIRNTSNIIQLENVITMDYRNGKELILNSTVDGQEQTINVEGVFVAIGQVPNTSFLDKSWISRGGYVINDNCSIKEPGIFVAGDCRERKSPNQVVINAGEGAIVGLKAVDFIKNGTI